MCKSLVIRPNTVFTHVIGPFPMVAAQAYPLSPHLMNVPLALERESHQGIVVVTKLQLAHTH